MKRIISLILTLSFIFCISFCFSTNHSAESICTLDGCDELFAVYGDDYGGFYLLCGSNEKYKIIHIESESSVNEYSLELSTNTNTYAYCNQKFYFCENSFRTSNGETQNFLTINIFDCDNGIVSKKIINDAYVLIDGTFSVDNENNYYLKNDTGVDVYSKNSIYKYSFEINSQPYNITSSNDGKIIYCTYADGVAVINNDSISKYSIIADKIFSENNNYFSTDSGEVYIYDGDSLSFVCNFNNSPNGVAVLNNYVLGIENDKLIVLENNDKIAICDAVNDSFLCSSANVCGCFTLQNGSIEVNFVTLDELKAKISQNENEQTASVSLNEDVIFTSEKYTFHSDNSTVTGIEPSSTIAVIKKNISLINCSAEFYDYNGNAKTSGTIGTGGKIDIITNETILHFNIIIFGDLSGEGNINTKDKTLLYKHLLGESQLDGCSFDAADLNSDYTVDLKDLVAMNNYFNNKYKLTQNR